jgi:hypothetical protein
MKKMRAVFLATLRKSSSNYSLVAARLPLWILDRIEVAGSLLTIHSPCLGGWSIKSVVATSDQLELNQKFPSGGASASQDDHHI